MQDWKRNLIIIWFSQFFSMVGMSAVVPFLPLFIRELGITNLAETALWSGLVFSGPFLLSFIMIPIWGSLSDRFGKKLMTVRAVFGLAAAQLLVGLSTNVVQLFLMRLLQGSLSGFNPSAMALISTYTPESKLSYSIGMLQSAVSAGNIFGPSIGGFLADRFGYRSVFFIVSGILLTVGIFIIIFVKENKGSNTIKPRSKLKDNWKFVLSNSKIRNSALLLTLSSFGFAFINPIFVLYLEDYHFDRNYFATIVGIVYAVVGIFSTISAPWWGKRSNEYNITRNIYIAAIITGLMFTLHFFISDLYLLIITRSILGFFYGGLIPLLFSYLNRFIPTESKGGILGVASSFQILGNMLAPITSGIISGYLGFRFPFIFAGGIFFLIGFVASKSGDK